MIIMNRNKPASREEKASESIQTPDDKAHNAIIDIAKPIEAQKDQKNPQQ